MSRVGKRILRVPTGTEVTIENNVLSVKGKLGTLTKTFSPLIAITLENNEIKIARANEEKHTKQLHGTTNSLIAAMLIGVSEGFKKEIIIKGVGYKAALKGKELEVIAGYSHPHLVQVVEGVQLELPKPTEIIITGVDKQAVGQMAALIRDVRRPNPYSGKGIMYKDEIIRRKEGKAASK